MGYLVVFNVTWDHSVHIFSRSDLILENRWSLQFMTRGGGGWGGGGGDIHFYWYLRPCGVQGHVGSFGPRF